jgi:gluconate 2-dehydrogenase gamma chain
VGQKENEKSEGMIKRRDMLKVFSAVPAALIPLGTTVAAERKAPAKTAVKTASGYQRKTFSDHEWETVKVLCDLVIPADERSGSATQAGVPEFIDDWLDFEGGVLPAEIHGGLMWLDMECHRQFGQDFARCSPADQRKILDRIAYPQKSAPEDSNYVAFFNHFRDLVAGGFYSSEVGIKDLPYLGNTMVADWEGCPPNVEAQIEKNLKDRNVGLSLENKD